jgi:hypothetical protein
LAEDKALRPERDARGRWLPRGERAFRRAYRARARDVADAALRAGRGGLAALVQRRDATFGYRYFAVKR